MTENLRDGLAKTLWTLRHTLAPGGWDGPAGPSIPERKEAYAQADAVLAYIEAHGYLQESEEAKRDLVYREAVAIATATGHVMTRTTEAGVEIIHDIWKGKDDQ